MNILYGALGEGMGHAIRSYVIIKRLMSKHRVQVVTSARAFNFLKGHFGDNVHEIKGFSLVYKDGGLSMPRTISSVLKFMLKAAYPNFKKYLEISKQFKEIGFEPDLAISDFESFSFLYSKIHDIPLLSLDNMQILSRCRLDFEIPPKEYYNYFMARKIVQLKVIHCNQYIITSFFDLPVIKRDTTIVPPVLRDEIIQAKPEAGSHILVYQTSSTKKGLAEILQNLPDETFHVYGLSKSSTEGNVIFKDFSEEEFIRDLSGAKAVLTNGGFTLITEALHLHKPVCSIPVENQFEQYVNAHYVEKSGWGKHLSSFNARGLSEFLENLPVYSKNLETYPAQDNEKTFEILEKIISSLV